MGSNTKVKCSFCDVTYNGGIFRHKKHLIGGYRDVNVCPNIPDKVKEEIKEYLLKKNEFKIQMNHEASMVNLVDNDEMDDDEVEVNMPMGPPSKHQRMPSSSGSGSSINSTIKCPMNLYFSQKPNEREKMYDAGLPFNCINYTESFGEFIEEVGQYGPGMKPPTYHEQKKNLRTLFMSTEWHESIYSKETLGKEVARHFISPFFWNDVVQALRVGGPLIHVLRMVDGEKKTINGLHL
ncbi:hypothetical protein H5410_014355 [Solanum commersonii]|uniref:Uncharacterized protein n=1 Tax=Solanum commersonii TaxID=4109 RepID=A0A9J5ZR06_SOLCO|nr:hypothetical protein H5410_014355 [Solanum commersonii]